MSERKVSDGEMQQIIRFNIYPAQETYLRKVVKTWSEADFLYVLDRLDVDLSGQAEEIRDRLHTLYRTLLKEHEEAEARRAVEAASAKRHTDILRQLEELKKPHWSIVPNFWMTLAILALTLIGVIVAILTLRR